MIESSFSSFLGIFILSPTISKQSAACPYLETPLSTKVHATGWSHPPAHTHTHTHTYTTHTIPLRCLSLMLALTLANQMTDSAM
ncbi:hypothetical protein B0T17DRAFT_63865 [Bombardia bombarda]|uniref:Secreted protein n=1 Tax=Bombardia bombarda TaxID=252184 RepID=A0AA39XKZ0_9PEZI|nr:hypothetical protein B0T17DRAFT_63865 [Bombardia bombarda]